MDKVCHESCDKKVFESGEGCHPGYTQTGVKICRKKQKLCKEFD